MEQFRGIFVPMITPFKDNEQVDEESIRRLVDFFIREGVHGIIATGNTGECSHLSMEEKKQVWKIVKEETKGRVPIIANLGTNCTLHSIDLSQYAERTGFDGVMLSPPSYYSLTEDELYSYYQTVASFVKIPIFLYHDIHGSRVDLHPALVAKLAEISNISYIKEYKDSRRIHAIIRLVGDKLTVFCAGGTITLESFLLGAKGWITGMHNLIPNLAVELYKLAVEKKAYEEAKMLYYKVLPFFSFMEASKKYDALVKEGVKMLGLQAGNPRRPLLPPPDEERKELAKHLESLGLKNICNI